MFNPKICSNFATATRNGALDEWLSQRSAKPCTAVRSRHAPLKGCTKVHPFFMRHLQLRALQSRANQKKAATLTCRSFLYHSPYEKQSLPCLLCLPMSYANIVCAFSLISATTPRKRTVIRKISITIIVFKTYILVLTMQSYDCVGTQTSFLHVLCKKLALS